MTAREIDITGYRGVGDERSILPGQSQQFFVTSAERNSLDRVAEVRPRLLSR